MRRCPHAPVWINCAWLITNLMGTVTLVWRGIRWAGATASKWWTRAPTPTRIQARVQTREQKQSWSKCHKYSACNTTSQPKPAEHVTLDTSTPRNSSPAASSTQTAGRTTCGTVGAQAVSKGTTCPTTVASCSQPHRFASLKTGSTRPTTNSIAKHTTSLLENAPPALLDTCWLPTAPVLSLVMSTLIPTVLPILIPNASTAFLDTILIPKPQSAPCKIFGVKLIKWLEAPVPSVKLAPSCKEEPVSSLL